MLGIATKHVLQQHDNTCMLPPINSQVPATNCNLANAPFLSTTNNTIRLYTYHLYTVLAYGMYVTKCVY